MFKGSYREYEEMKAKEKEEKAALRDDFDVLSRRREEENAGKREHILELRRKKRTLKNASRSWKKKFSEEQKVLHTRIGLPMGRFIKTLTMPAVWRRNIKSTKTSSPAL